MNHLEENDVDEVFMNPVVTCGLCETICNINNFIEHECLNGYADYHFDENSCYFYPMCADGTILRRSLINDQEVTVQENPVITTNKRKNIRKKLSVIDKEDLLQLEEQLILEVHVREALWNPQVDLSRRSRKATAQLWKEVSEALNSKLSETEAKIKFKSLHDTFRRIISAELLASGSERPVKKSKWQHYENLSFLRDSCLQKPTKSNLSFSANCDDEESTDTNFEDVEQNRQQKHINRKQGKNKKEDSNSTAIDRIADAFCQRSLQPPITLPDVPKDDEVDAIVSVVEKRLRKLPPELLDDAAQRIFQLTYDLIKDSTQ